MSNPPYGGMPPAQAPWPQQGPPPARQPSRLPLILTAALAVIAIIVAIASWFRPAPEPEAQAAEQQFSEQEVADAKEAMCEAWETTYSSIKNVASKNSPDPTLTYVFVLESQVVFHVAGNYLADKLRENPAAPAELTHTFARLINSYQDMVLARLGDLPETEVEPIKNRMDSAADAIKQECK